MAKLVAANLLSRTRFERSADWLAIAVAVSLPWSTSATSILVVLWLIAVIPTVNIAAIRQVILSPAGGLPVALFALGVLGMLWADATLSERFQGLYSFSKLLMTPLLLVQFRRSDRGLWVIGSYLLSCCVLLAVSTSFYFVPALSPGHVGYLPVKNAATQSGEFVICIFGLFFLVIEFLEQRRWLWLVGCLVVVGGMLANIFYLATGRTALSILPVLLVVLATKKLKVRGVVVLFTGAILLGVIGWCSSPYLRNRTIAVWTEIQNYEATDARNSSGERLEFWKKSVSFVREAPTFGHGTGSIHSLFTASSAGQREAAGSATTNPHNQTFAVAIQLGLVGAGILWAMWIAHMFLFRGNGLVDWVGLVVVVQNIVGSLFNSHLFDFVQGWVYVFGVGVAGGMVFKRLASTKTTDISTTSP